MANKYLNTRILLKYDTLENWTNNNPQLKAGEVAVVAIPEGAHEHQVSGTTPPQILFKVGDGDSHFKDLKWASGMAADVYAWAKAKNKPTYNASEITGLTEFVEGISDIDTNTTYKIEAIAEKPGKYKFYSKEKGGKFDTGFEFGIDENAIKALITTAQNKANSAYELAEGKADKTKAVGSFEGTGSATITPVFVGGGKGTAFTVNKVAEATKAAQDGNGKNIASTYATIETVNGKLGNTETAADSAKLEGKTKVQVIEEARTGYATTEYVDNKVAGSVQYLGLASKLSDLDKNAGKGDFYRASADFSGVSSGDLIVSLKDEVKTQTIDTENFAVVKSSDDYQGTVKSVAGTGSNGITVTGGPITETGTLTISHNAGSAASKAKGFYKISTDAGSHVASVETVTASDITETLGYTPYNSTNPNGYTTNKGTVTSVSGTDGLKGSVTTSGSLSVDFDVVAKKTDLPTVNNGKFTVKGDGTSITGTGSMTANQSGNTEATLAVADYSNIMTAKNATNSISTAGDLVTENGDTIFFYCGTSKF